MAYHVEGNHLRTYSVCSSDGGMEYDLLESRTEADEICEALNLGIGPEWDEIEKYLLEDAQ